MSIRRFFYEWEITQTRDWTKHNTPKSIVSETTFNTIWVTGNER